MFRARPVRLRSICSWKEKYGTERQILTVHDAQFRMMLFRTKLNWGYLATVTRQNNVLLIRASVGRSATIHLQETRPKLETSRGVERSEEVGRSHIGIREVVLS